MQQATAARLLTVRALVAWDCRALTREMPDGEQRAAREIGVQFLSPRKPLTLRTARHATSSRERAALASAAQYACIELELSPRGKCGKRE
jgi:hypothetical protein